MSIKGDQAPSDSAQKTVTRAHDGHPPHPSPLGTPLASAAAFCAQLPSSSVNSFCGAMAGVASGVVTCPLDVIKTKLQGQNAFRSASGKLQSGSGTIYNGMVGTARVIWRQDGVRGMYRGLGPMLLGYLPTWAVYMSVYESSRESYYQKIENKWVARISASITAGACSTLVTNPIWVIKTRLMSQTSSRATDEIRTPWQYKSTLDAARKMYRTEGLGAFYSGLAPALLGLTHVAIQFPLYEYFKMQFTGLQMGESSSEDENMHWAGIAAATFLSKVCATSATYPHEVLRTRLQTQQNTLPHHSPEEIAFRGALGHGGSTRARGSSSSDGMINIPRYRGIVQTCRIILKEEGWRAFYNGMGTNMIRAVPAAMTTMLTFETLKSTITRVQHEGQKVLEEEDD
ncbi:calcium-binding mitochondrial carrier protein Aralar2 [Lineolata rhizophorae]|uniref:Calcium-binding mitochondrial carrier protein Aralar2 n=1 Tax=Lineolata rhizophorae TaxID=578093 RepID=A0A6A6PC70_9PEZI|nr:calcium-binding mitochondrial carrier protein Aralar2 [Lineolata rhizophorae]